MDEDNLQIHYAPGPPSVLQIHWVNRLSQSFADEKSSVNQLAQCYGENCNTAEKDKFTSD